MSTEEYKALIDRWTDMWNTGDLTALEEIIAPDCSVSLQSNRPWTLVGPEAYARMVTSVRAQWPDWFETTEDMLVDGDRMAVRWRATATHTRELTTPWGVTIAPTGKQVVWTGMSIVRIAAGKMVEQWTLLDSMNQWRQLGVIPERG